MVNVNAKLVFSCINSHDLLESGGVVTCVGLHDVYHNLVTFYN